MSRIPGMRSIPPNLRVVVTPYVCASCGEVWQHVEAMPAEDDPYGLPPQAFCHDCGGELRKVAA